MHTIADCTAVIPFRSDDDPIRMRNLQAVLTALSAMPMDVIVIELSTTPECREPAGDRVRVLWEESTGPFPKARACNTGVLAARTSMVALIDADMLVRPEALHSSARLVDRMRRLDVAVAVRPYGRLVDLDERASLVVTESDVLPQPEVLSSDDSRAAEVIPLAGGMLVLGRDTYLGIGGMDESFVGWGGEDDALSSALRRSGVSTRVLTNEVAFHLWHDRGRARRYGHGDYPANAARAIWWRDCPDDEFTHAVSVARADLIGRAGDRGD